VEGNVSLVASHPAILAYYICDVSAASSSSCSTPHVLPVRSTLTQTCHDDCCIYMNAFIRRTAAPLMRTWATSLCRCSAKTPLLFFLFGASSSYEKRPFAKPRSGQTKIKLT
jgi:hypothetical protein